MLIGSLDSKIACTFACTKATSRGIRNTETQVRALPTSTVPMLNSRGTQVRCHRMS